MGDVVSLDAWRRDRVWRPDEDSPLLSRRPACYDEAMPANTELRPPREAHAHVHADFGPFDARIRVTLRLNVPVPRTHDRVTHLFAVALLTPDGSRVIKGFRREFKGESEARSAYAAAVEDAFVAAGYLSGWAR